MKIAAITAERVASLVPSCERAAPGATVPEAQLPQQHLSCSGVSECRCWARLRLLVHARRETHHRLPCRDASTVSQFGGKATLHPATGWPDRTRNPVGAAPRFLIYSGTVELRHTVGRAALIRKSLRPCRDTPRS
jgi:hypothetical protein